MRKGGRYVVDKKTGKAERVEWTKTQAEAEAEKAEKKAAESAPKAAPEPVQNGSKAK